MVRKFLEELKTESTNTSAEVCSSQRGKGTKFKGNQSQYKLLSKNPTQEKQDKNKTVNLSRGRE